MGMLTLFSLFPSGLKQVETAHERTQEAMFGNYVLSTMRADAVLLTADQWVAIDNNTFPDFTIGSIVTEQYPPGSGQYMRYYIALSELPAHNVWTVTLWCRSGQYGATNLDIFKKGATKFYTEFFYSGMP
jgi:hypothetical protein